MKKTYKTSNKVYICYIYIKKAYYIYIIYLKLMTYKNFYSKLYDNFLKNNS